MKIKMTDNIKTKRVNEEIIIPQVNEKFFELQGGDIVKRKGDTIGMDYTHGTVR